MVVCVNERYVLCSDRSVYIRGCHLLGHVYVAYVKYFYLYVKDLYCYLECVVWVMFYKPSDVMH